MSITILSAEIVRRMPAMAQDCPVNNEHLIFKLISEVVKCEFEMSGELFHALDAVVEDSSELLSMHDAGIGRTTSKNMNTALGLEFRIAKAKLALERYKKARKI